MDAALAEDLPFRKGRKPLAVLDEQSDPRANAATNRQPQKPAPVNPAASKTQGKRRKGAAGRENLDGKGQYCVAAPVSPGKMWAYNFGMNT